MPSYVMQCCSSSPGLLLSCCHYELSVLHSLYGTFYYKVNRDIRVEKHSQCFGVSIGSCREEDIGQNHKLYGKSFTWTVSSYSRFRMGSADLIEKEKGRWKEREKLLQTRTWFMKSIPLFVQASSLCMRNGGSVRRQMSRPHGRGREMAPLNSAGNQLVKLNIKKTRMIVCGKAICLQLATSRITHAQTRINTFMSNRTRHVMGCVCAKI